MVVGHLHPVADDGVGDGDGGVFDGGIARAFQIFFDGIHDGVVVGAGQHFNVFKLLLRGF